MSRKDYWVYKEEGYDIAVSETPAGLLNDHTEFIQHVVPASEFYKAIEALKYYAKVSTWQEGSDQCHASQVSSSDTEPANDELSSCESDYCAGKLARDTLKDLGEYNKTYVEKY